MQKTITKRLQALLAFIYADKSYRDRENVFYDPFGVMLFISPEKSGSEWSVRRREKALSDLKMLLHNAMENLLNHGSFKYYPIDEVDYDESKDISLCLGVTRDGIIRKKVETRNYNSVYRFHVMNILDGVPIDLIRRCQGKDCDHYYVAWGEKKKYCSSRCRSRTIMDKRRRGLAPTKKRAEKFKDAARKSRRYAGDPQYRKSKRTKEREKYHGSHFSGKTRTPASKKNQPRGGELTQQDKGNTRDKVATNMVKKR